MSGDDDEEKVNPDRPKLIPLTINDWDDNQLSLYSPPSKAQTTYGGAPTRKSKSYPHRPKSQQATPTVKRNRSRTWQLPASSISAYAAWIESKPTKYRSLAEVHFLEKYRLKTTTVTSSFVEDSDFSLRGISRSTGRYSNTTLTDHTKGASDVLRKVEHRGQQTRSGHEMSALDPGVTMLPSAPADSVRMETTEGYLDRGLHTPDATGNIDSAPMNRCTLYSKESPFDSLQERMDQLGISRTSQSFVDKKGDWPMSQPR